LNQTRYPSGILATAVVPWTEDWRFDEATFRREIALQLAAGYRDLYIFGTAGEGHAVSDDQFRQIIRVFVDALAGSSVQPMVGVISLSLATVLDRIAVALDLGARRFQISLPSWGVLDVDETRRFFDVVLGRFPNVQFLHYNLLRAKRLVTPEEYGRIAADHPNLVATKNTTDSLTRVRDLIEQAPTVLHFLGETGYTFGSQIGECGLLVSAATINARTGRAFYEAGRSGDLATLVRYEGELHEIAKTLVRLAGDGHIDSAYDKVLWRLHDPHFPLRLLPPYTAARPTAAEELADFLRRKYPHWSPE
jgi:dihydrodipicolinate synthase/N-acetylneuraminate lyase